MTVSVKGGGQGEQTPPNPPATTPKNAEPNPPATSGTDQPSNVIESAQQDNEPAEESELLLPSGEPIFPVAELTKLDEMINRQRWVVPVLPKGELEVLLEAAIKLCKAGMCYFVLLDIFVGGLNL
jgi:ubiquitin carboxyl-terminal hydrolase 9/24